MYVWFKGELFGYLRSIEVFGFVGRGRSYRGRGVSLGRVEGG